MEHRRLLVYTKAMAKKMKGFSLIELMIVIAILAIIATVAIPAYGDYVVRSKVSTMITTVEVVQKAVSEYRTINGNLSQIDPTNAANTLLALGVVDPTPLTTAMSSVQFAKLNDNAMAIVLCGSTVGQGTASVDTVDLYLTGTFITSGMTWSCAYAGNSKYVPNNCRNIYAPTVYGTPAVACVH